ncbi:hypothetical protein E2C01_022501 [Portunus trituberculatus]|uniref:Uncharacterized protein n=1 Tax=Portunus trituberculatus TaxID=210409 RepID=A0A5B7E7U7_PORTR|nr:hypothetical protein [Portunus trituberculatus]
MEGQRLPEGNQKVSLPRPSIAPSPARFTPSLPSILSLGTSPSSPSCPSSHGEGGRASPPRLVQSRCPAAERGELLSEDEISISVKYSYTDITRGCAKTNDDSSVHNQRGMSAGQYLQGEMKSGR